MFVQNQLLTKGMVILRDKIRFYEGTFFCCCFFFNERLGNDTLMCVFSELCQMRDVVFLWLCDDITSAQVHTFSSSQ